MIIIIDDDPISSKIAALSIKKGIPEEQCIVFNNPEVALKDIHELKETQPELNPLLLIDINMPEMSGWEFIEALNILIPESENRYLGMILSSSVDPADIDKAKSYQRIIQFLTKPFTLETTQLLREFLV
jgi:response regulator RpfG family c-di-GMP phosphodiesterase